MPRPRLLFVGNHLGRHGWPMSASEELMAQLAARGWVLRSSSSSPAYVRRALERLIDTVRLARDYDVAHVDVFSGPAFFWAETVVATLRALGKPFVLVLHGGNLPVFAPRWPRRVRALLAHAARIVAPSPYLRRSLQPFAPRLIEVIPNGIDASVHAPFVGQGDDGCIVWLRAFHALYQPELLPRVLRRLHDRGLPLRLRMVGPDKGDGALARTRALVDSLGLAAYVTFVGGVDKRQVPAEMSRGTYYVNSSSVDNQPVTVLEAMSCGRAIVSTAVGGLPDLLDDGQSALLASTPDAPALAEALERLVRDDLLRARVRAGALAASERYAFPAVVAAWEALYTSVYASA